MPVHPDYSNISEEALAQAKVILVTELKARVHIISSALENGNFGLAYFAIGNLWSGLSPADIYAEVDNNMLVCLRTEDGPALQSFDTIALTSLGNDGFQEMRDEVARNVEQYDVMFEDAIRDYRGDTVAFDMETGQSTDDFLDEVLGRTSEKKEKE